MWKDGKRAKKRQKTKGQLRGKAAVEAAVGAAAAIGEEAIKDKEGEIWDKKALNTLFNKMVQYLVINSYISTITELYI